MAKFHAASQTRGHHFSIDRIIGFYLKLNLYFETPFKLDNLKIILSNSEYYTRLFSSGFSMVHYLGYLGVIYFVASLSRQSLPLNLLKFCILIGYGLTLVLLLIKVQFVIFLFLLFGYLLFLSSRFLIVLLCFLCVVFVGLSITAYDNYRMSSKIIMFEFIIRYIGGSIIGFDQLMAKGYFNFLHWDNLYFNNYRYALARLGFFEHFDTKSLKIFYQLMRLAIGSIQVRCLAACFHRWVTFLVRCGA